MRARWVVVGLLAVGGVAGANETASSSAAATPSASGGVVMKPKCTVERQTGKFEAPQGQVYRPEGTYGSIQRLNVRGTEGVREEVGTYVKPEGTFRRPQEVVVQPEGRYIAPYGSAPQAIGERGLSTERMPVAGHEPGYFMVKDSRGATWQIDDPALIRRAEERMQAAGVSPGRVDGVADRDFGMAIVKYQQKMSLPTTGVIDEATARSLGLDWNQLNARVEQLKNPPMRQQQQPTP